MSVSEIVLLLVCLALFIHSEIRAWRYAPALRRLSEFNVKLVDHIMAMGSTARRDVTQAFVDLVNAKFFNVPANMAPPVGQATAPAAESDGPDGPEAALAEAWLAEQKQVLATVEARTGSLKAQSEPEHSMAG